MKLVVDVNLPPKWVVFLGARGIEAVHWSQVGDLRATDAAIMAWARDGGYVVLTSDLDFSALLATSSAMPWRAAPSSRSMRSRRAFVSCRSAGGPVAKGPADCGPDPQRPMARPKSVPA